VHLELDKVAILPPSPSPAFAREMHH
jgi:hypothetical protein